VYPCCCTRKEIADSAINGIEGPVYPGTCRHGIPAGREGRAWRVRTDISPFDKPVLSNVEGLRANGSVEFEDALQDRITQHLESEIGDFVVKRADGLLAYQLAVVVDDAFQSITHIVRGADLLDSTPRQIYLQRLLGLHIPQYLHLPVAVNAAGEKLSKQTLAAPVDETHPARTLLRVLEFLQQQPPADLAGQDVKSVLDWAIANWDATRMRGIKSLPAS
jgi:glutamyl-Q tRNA(Asp) synthetase